MSIRDRLRDVRPVTVVTKQFGHRNRTIFRFEIIFIFHRKTHFEDENFLRRCNHEIGQMAGTFFFFHLSPFHLDDVEVIQTRRLFQVESLDGFQRTARPTER